VSGGRHQALLGAAITTETPPGRMLPPILFEPPWPLVSAPEVWIATAGDAAWGGAQVLVSEDDDDYRRYAGQLSSAMTVGTLLDPIPEAPAHRIYLPVTFRVRLHGERELPAATPAQAIARMTDALVGDEIVATTTTRLMETVDGDHVYQCSGSLIRAGYGTGRRPDWTVGGHDVGTPFVRFDREVFRFAYEPRHVGQRLWFKLAAQNEHADPDATEEPEDVEPVSLLVRGAFYQRDPRRWL
jgi:hypothetical protein